jgi:transcriptional regulator GlxA family with amidase domain
MGQDAKREQYEDGDHERCHGSNSCVASFLPPVAEMSECIDFLPFGSDDHQMTLEKVAVVVQDGAAAFGLGSMCEVWGEEYHPDDDNPVFDFKVCAARPGRVRGQYGFDLMIEHGLEVVEAADLVCVAPRWEYRNNDPDVIEAVRAAHDRGAVVSAHCTASFLLGDAGLLDGRECTTHWRYADILQREFPAARVNPDVLYVLDGNVLTGAGSAAGIDAQLHLMRREFGARVAATTARRIVVPPHRDGGQAQFIRTPMGQTEADTLAPLLEWATEHLDEALPVERLAAQAHMSARTFARRFRDETGTTPLQWITGQRLALAQELLEQTALSVEQIAGRVGFGNAATLRHHFTTTRGTTPQAYRRTFTCLDERETDEVPA